MLAGTSDWVISWSAIEEYATNKHLYDKSVSSLCFSLQSVRDLCLSPLLAVTLMAWQGQFLTFEVNIRAWNSIFVLIFVLILSIYQVCNKLQSFTGVYSEETAQGCQSPADFRERGKKNQNSWAGQDHLGSQAVAIQKSLKE